LAPDTVHGNAVVELAEAGDESDNPEVRATRTQVVQGEGAVFAAAPQESCYSRRGHDECREGWPSEP
jgi:hypothetical protein